MDQPMSKEESYADRRKLFKNIWDTAMNIDEKEGNVISKPKVIKTLRLDEVDRCIAGKKKKQRIKNLRLVCNKLLDFCDRQDADDVYYEQMIEKGRKSPIRNEEDHNMPKRKVTKEKRKAKKARSMFTRVPNAVETRTISPNRREDLTKIGYSKSSRNTSPIKIKRASFVYKSQLMENKFATNKNNYDRKREKRNKVQKVPMQVSGTKMLIAATHTYSNKQLFPINKITIK